MLLANSLVEGFVKSNLMGQGIVALQILGSIVMLAVIIGKSKELAFMGMLVRRFMRDFSEDREVLDYCFRNRPLKLLTPDTRSMLAGRGSGNPNAAALTAREIELVKGACEHALDEEEIKVERGMGAIATIVALSPMLGLLGTVWGVLDAFAEMGSAGSANLATIAPSISSALVTTVVGLLIAIPGVMAYNKLTSTVRNLTSDMEGFADELIGRIACEFQGRGE